MNPIGERSCYDEGKRAAETLTFDYKREHGLEVTSGMETPPLHSFVQSRPPASGLDASHILILMIYSNVHSLASLLGISLCAQHVGTCGAHLQHIWPKHGPG